MQNPDKDTNRLTLQKNVHTQELKVMDLTAFTMCKENDLPVIVFDMDTPGNLSKVLTGENCGTIVGK